MSRITDFPLDVLTPIDGVSLAMAYDTRPGQEATNGMGRSPGLTGGRHKMKFQFMVHDEAAARTARALFWNMEGDSGLIRIRTPDLYGIDGPFAISTKAIRQAYPNGVPFASDVMFSTGVGFRVPTLEAKFSEAAALNAREIYVTAEEELPAGCAISIDEFCYGIAGSWTDDDGRNRVRLSPPLRKAAGADDIIALAPTFVGFCLTDTPGYEALTAGMYGTHELEFIEDLARLVVSTD
jgi:hypothetical protein